MNTRLVCTLCLACAGCGSSDKLSPTDIGPALFVLPYPVGASHRCTQSFEGSISHHDLFRFSIDFAMEIGTEVTAARAGGVVHVEQRYSDSDTTSGHENVVIVSHEDGTFSRYAHLKQSGALVESGASVIPGDVVGLSGNSGSGGGPHLHFDVVANADQRDVQTVPFAFRNVAPAHVILEPGVSYTAAPY